MKLWYTYRLIAVKAVLLNLNCHPLTSLRKVVSSFYDITTVSFVIKSVLYIHMQFHYPDFLRKDSVITLYNKML
jgi:hypothetical protein